MPPVSVNGAALFMYWLLQERDNSYYLWHIIPTKCLESSEFRGKWCGARKNPKAAIESPEATKTGDEWIPG